MNYVLKGMLVGVGAGFIAVAFGLDHYHTYLFAIGCLFICFKVVLD